MEISLPDIREQQQVIFEEATKEAIATLKENLKVEHYPPQDEVNESQYPRSHLLREHEGWEAPHKDIVAAYFGQLQRHFPEYGTDKKIAALIGVSSDRRVREFKSGERKVPYGIWRRFLILTGRAPQDVLKVLGYMA